MRLMSISHRGRKSIHHHGIPLTGRSMRPENFPSGLVQAADHSSSGRRSLLSTAPYPVLILVCHDSGAGRLLLHAHPRTQQSHLKRGVLTALA